MRVKAGALTLSLAALLVAPVAAAKPPGPELSIGDVAAKEGDLGPASFTFTVTVTEPSNAPITYTFATDNGSATSPSDYNAQSGTRTIAAGSTSDAVTVTVNGDTAVEPNETFHLTLTGATGADLGDRQGVGTIQDDDGPPALSIGDASVTEGNGGTANAAFAVRLTKPAAQAVTATFATTDGTARAPGDYVPGQGSVTFAPGQTATTVTVVVQGDADDEPNEVFYVDLANAQGAGVADGRGVGTIVDDDGAAQPDPVIRLAGGDRVDTAVSVSRARFPNAGSAGAVVLARSDRFPDALAGTPFAVAKNAPILLTPPDGLDPRTAAEISRVLARGRTVYLLGGEQALSTKVMGAVGALGYAATRVAGADRFDTAVKVAEATGLPAVIIVATGTDFADALSGGAAAVQNRGVVVLTDGPTMPAATRSFIAAHPVTPRFALGGPAAKADPGASAVVGADRYATSALVARRLFTQPTAAGTASGSSFPDSLSGGAHIGAERGPLLLVQLDTLPAAVASYLSDNRGSIAAGYLYGGSRVVSEDVRLAVQAAITG